MRMRAPVTSGSTCFSSLSILSFPFSNSHRYSFLKIFLRNRSSFITLPIRSSATTYFSFWVFIHGQVRVMAHQDPVTLAIPLLLARPITTSTLCGCSRLNSFPSSFWRINSVISSEASSISASSKFTVLAFFQLLFLAVLVGLGVVLGGGEVGGVAVHGGGGGSGEGGGASRGGAPVLRLLWLHPC